MYFQEKFTTIAMETNKTENVVQEIHKLIDHSCSQTHYDHTVKFERFHRAILKKFFKSDDVQLQHLADKIQIKIKLCTSAIKGQYITMEVGVEKLEKFLKACVAQDKSNRNFYLNMLNYYATSAEGNMFSL